MRNLHDPLLRDGARLVGRRRLLKGVLVAAAALAAEPVLAACGGGSAAPAATPSASLSSLAAAGLANAIQGDWTGYVWYHDDGVILPEEAASKWGITDPLEMDQFFAAEKADPSFALTVGPGTFTISGPAFGTDWMAAITGEPDGMKGTWDLVARRFTITNPSAPDPDQVDSYAVGVPAELASGAAGSMTWQWVDSSEEQVTYAVGKQRILIDNPGSGVAVLVVGK